MKLILYNIKMGKMKVKFTESLKLPKIICSFCSLHTFVADVFPSNKSNGNIFTISSIMLSDLSIMDSVCGLFVWKSAHLLILKFKDLSPFET